MNRFTIDYVKKYFGKFKYKVISDNYINAHQNLEIICPQGHETKITWMSFKRGSRCRECSPSKKIEYEQAFDYFKKFNYKMLTKKTDYKNSETKIKLMCPKNHVYTTSYATFKQQNTRCKKCYLENKKGKGKLSTSEISKNLKKIGLIYINEGKYKKNNSKIKAKCVEGHVVERMYSTFSKYEKCPVCKKQEIKQNRILYQTKQIKEICNDIGYKPLDIEKYKNAKTKIKIKCNKNHVFYINSNNLKRGKRCPHCNVYKNEEECREIFQEITGKKFKKCRPDFLVNPETGCKLELDGFNEESKIAFEYDGEQHFSHIPYFMNIVTFQTLQKNDKIKDELCKQYDIKLIRIPYWVEDKKEYIIKKMGNESDK